MSMSRLPSFTSVVALTLLAGCTSLQTIHHTNDQVDQDDREATASIAAARATSAPPKRDAVQVHIGEQWVSTKAVPLAKQLPAELRCPVTFGSSDGNVLLALAQVISKQCHVPVRVTPDALTAIGVGPSAAQGNAVAAGPAPILPPGAVAVPPISGMPGGLSASMTGAVSANNNALAAALADVRYDNVPLDELLNAQTARLGISWKYEDGSISIYYLDTRSFTLFSIPTTTNMQSVVTSGTTTSNGTSGGTAGGGGASGGSSSGGIGGNNGSAQSTEVTLKTSVADDVVAAVKSMISPSGRTAFSPATGKLTVTDTPEVLNRIGSYIKDQNKTLSKQVLLNFRILTVTVTDKNSLGLNWDAIYTNLARNYNIKLNSAFQADSAATTAGINILTGSSKWSGSNAMVDALAKQGHVSMLTQPSVTTLNMEPVPVQVAKQTAYLAQSQTLIGGGTSDLAQNSLTPGTVTAGFNMNVMPFVLPDDESMLLQFSINLSSLDQIRTFTSGNASVELPELSQSIFSQKVRLKSGDTLVLSGYEQSALNGQRQGAGDSHFWAFGGGGSTDNQRQVIVILITPVVLD